MPAPETKAPRRPRLFGSHHQTMDDRSRIPVPSRMMSTLRELCGADAKEAPEVTVGITTDGHLGVFPQEDYEAELDRLERLQQHSAKAKRKLRFMYRYRDDQVLDKQNRVRLPPQLVELFKLGRDVTVVGEGRFLMIMTKEAWIEQTEKDIRDMESLDEELQGLDPDEFAGAFGGDDDGTPGE